MGLSNVQNTMLGDDNGILDSEEVGSVLRPLLDVGQGDSK